MSSYAVVVIRIEFENFAHEVIDAFAANRADEAFYRNLCAACAGHR
jgi:hypothetical protein